jgi:FMN phosphatase YigB (HAD superfamily)
MITKFKTYFDKLFPKLKWQQTAQIDSGSSALAKQKAHAQAYLEDAYTRACALGLFNANWYEARYGQFSGPLAAFSDYLDKSRFANVNPSVNFDTETYHRNHLDIYHSGESPLLHYIYHGGAEGRQIAPAHLRWTPNNALIAKETSTWQTQKIAICLHVFYADFVEKFESCLSNFPCHVDVFVAVATDEIKQQVETVFTGIANVQQLKVIVAPNRGRNFGPLLVEFGKELLEYDLMCHVHSKKSLYSGREQTQWFDYLNQFLFKDLHVVSCLLRLFDEKPELGIYYPTSFWMMPSWVNHWTCNRPFAQEFVDDWELDTAENFINYPVGGMFWARPQALKQLLEKDFSYEDFPEEPLPNDGSWLHALERTLGLLAVKNNYQQFFYDPPSATFTTDQSYIFANYNKTPERLFAELRNFEVVSFDVFDTVLRREFTEPDYAKLKVGKVLEEQSVVANAQSFVTIRNGVEGDIRKAKSFKGDVSIVEVYAALAKRFDWDSEQHDTIMAMEFDFDLQQVKAKDEMVNLVYQLSDLGREIWFITDTYYTHMQMETMLRRIGISLAYKLFVSSDLGLRKDSGTMWHFIKNELTTYQLSHIHVGDNVRSDAQLCGDLGLANMHLLHPIDKWQAAGLGPVLTESKTLDENKILKWGRLVGNLGRYPFFGE